MRLKLTNLLFCILAGLAFALAVAFAGGEVEKLGAQEERDRESAAAAIRKLYQDTVRELVAQAGKDVKPRKAADGTEAYPHRDAKHLAILLLGDLRAAEAVPVLLKNLKYRNPVRLEGSYMGIGGWYPAAESLSKIGTPAIAPTLEKLGRSSTDSLERRLCVWVIKDALGGKLAKACLDIAVEDATRYRQTRKAKNLKDAIPLLDAPGVPFPSGEPAPLR